MKNYTQVYVKNSVEAARHYCNAFGAEITREFWNADHTEYEHCELSVNGEGFLALAEAQNPCDVALVHKLKWETMTFNVFEMGTEEAVRHAFDVLSEGRRGAAARGAAALESLQRHGDRQVRCMLVDRNLIGKTSAWMRRFLCAYGQFTYPAMVSSFFNSTKPFFS